MCVRKTNAEFVFGGKSIEQRTCESISTRGLEERKKSDSRGPQTSSYSLKQKLNPFISLMSWQGKINSSIGFIFYSFLFKGSKVRVTNTLFIGCKKLKMSFEYKIIFY